MIKIYHIKKNKILLIIKNKMNFSKMIQLNSLIMISSDKTIIMTTSNNNNNL
jgi:hypothetical protein